MGNANNKPIEMHSAMPQDKAASPATDKPKSCKACCACPDTKRLRDACIVENGQENCTKLIEDHKDCMRKMGFNI